MIEVTLLFFTLKYAQSSINSVMVAMTKHYFTFLRPKDLVL